MKRQPIAAKWVPSRLRQPLVVQASLALLLAIGSLTFSGCAENSESEPRTDSSPSAEVVEPTSLAAAEVTPKPQEPETKQTQEAEQTDQEKEESGILGKAGELLGRATRGGTESAKNAGKWMKDTFDQASESTGTATRGTVDWANQTFQSLKDQGLTTASSTSEWLAEDWNNMESWEYKILSIDGQSNSDLESLLNQLGEAGWECFSADNSRLMLKRQRESYLRRLPFRDLIRLAPLLNSARE